MRFVLPLLVFGGTWLAYAWIAFLVFRSIGKRPRRRSLEPTADP